MSLLPQVFMCSLLTYSLTITSVKISLLVLYRRVFDTLAFRKRSLIVGLACLLWGVIAIFTTIFQCRPLTAAFDPASLFTYHCIDIERYYIGMVASNLGIDIVMLVLPLHMVWNLQLPLSQRVALSGIFSIGLLWVSFPGCRYRGFLLMCCFQGVYCRYCADDLHNQIQFF